ncbi:response regulator [Campylobacter geochelonis]|uniref:Response regulator receiver domain-containing protein n=1 Tax=Campylobacter geochelonis TaxID=1780362 RepID=A0A128EQJ6_9BACT|nr:response regulator [Campylobacter geochelonis]QKF70887.1 two-component system response regulator [Campylobacter geochelonis]CZE47953.1 response regulator receiver domain-containing protein [Campylobacter geochelonis]CZE48892.1 response regulator receiver domain-containing protein [Campylobacter geochelonis]CZE51381.1 response regulator receiver domain-containing protein [Campylobacter geochelonis]
MRKINILTIDDDFINLKLLEAMLKSHESVGEIIKATNGLDGLNIIDQRDDIDLVLLDIVMPVMNGLEFLDNLKARKNAFSKPVIVITTDEAVKREAFNKGANDFLTKPILKKVLLEKIDKLIVDFE